MKKFILASVLVVALPVLSGCWKKEVAPDATPVQVAEDVAAPSDDSSKEEYVA
ncbi:MAG TPA: hypothetical protein VLG50_01855 [Candidatus Saccharimonadales bacterium]|nr:hypothetical protein [Candidatus Saccharimonadales bacterium]